MVRNQTVNLFQANRRAASVRLNTGVWVRRIQWGRRPLAYQIQPTVNYVAGIEISRTHSRVIVMDLSMTIIEETKYPMRHDSTPEKIVELIQSDLLRILQKYNITASKLLGIGVGAVGPLEIAD